jgi:hypothetical protein
LLAGSVLVGVVLLALAGRVPTAQAGRTPPAQIQNGRAEPRDETDVARAIAAVSPAASTDRVWLAWQVALVDGDRDLCGWYSERLGTIRGHFIDPPLAPPDEGAPTRPQLTPPVGPIRLDAGTELLVFVRAVGGQVERLRTAGSDCPIDAGGHPIHWLGRVRPDDSLRFLTGLVDSRTNDTASDLERRAADTAMRTIALHRDAGADAALLRFAADPAEATGRRQAASALVSYRGAGGVDLLMRLARTSDDPGVRAEAVRALSQSTDARVARLMEEILKR